MNFIHVRKNARQIQQQKRDAETRMREMAFLPDDELFAKLAAVPTGLTAETAEEKLEEFGRNVITTGNTNTALRRLREATINPFNVILMVIAIITVFTDIIYAGSNSWSTVIIIVSLIILSSAVAFVQSTRSNTAAEQLTKMISNKADALRDGRWTELPIDEIVQGDIVRLSAGDMLPADVRFLTTKDTFVAQAALTGESNPVEKFNDIRSNP